MTPVGPVLTQSPPSQDETQRIDYGDEKEDVVPRDPYHCDDARYKIVQRRYPPLSRNDTVFFDRTTLKPHSVHGQGFLIPDKNLVQVHPLKFLKTDYEKNPEMLAVTPSGKHVVLQQAVRSCVPAAITMLALDLGGVPLYEYTLTKNLTSWDMEMVMISQAGFKPKIYEFQTRDPYEKAQALEKVLADGPGLLDISHSDLKGHVVVLDAISLKTRQITWRDSYHGWMVTADLFPTIECIGANFIQLLPLRKKPKDE